jgi:hypothetical protein
VLGLPEGVQVFEYSLACTFAAQRYLLLQVWREPPSVSTFERLDAHYQALIAQQPLVVD